ncbi:hydroxysteroid dehydrogenase-like protein 1 [Sabethes cyaneus]|uniref:hydroxysteroid dehydrogenase-like protein 1 n=1 Tax=Sabethes cyaneus TaxID=53552 RepID=UPI00237DC39A|nr:hydroxysteroid dehydrogenase-like protein 1 [Sabethes cyaneus]
MQFDVDGFVLYLLAAVGVYASVIYFYECARSPLAILWSVIFPNRKPLSERYGPWAVITGSSDGIGKQYAINLASKGMNVFLISRTESKLAELAEQIRSQYSVDVQWMAIDFSQGVQIFETIRKSISGLTIGILVNNVAVGQDYLLEFERFCTQDVQQTISVNVTAAVMMTHMLLPEMKQRRRGLIVNVSSVAGLAPGPYITLYAASKAFLDSFTTALSQELHGSGVESQLVTPLFVRTNINKRYHAVKFSTQFFTDVKRFGKHAVFTIGRSDSTTGYWAHGIQISLFRLLPVRVRTAVWYYVAGLLKNKEV